jgi:hypothetical protein
MTDSNVILKELKNIGEGLPLYPDILRFTQDDMERKGARICQAE